VVIEDRTENGIGVTAFQRSNLELPNHKIGQSNLFSNSDEVNQMLINMRSTHFVAVDDATLFDDKME
jgi:hypothetical protein